MLFGSVQFKSIKTSGDWGLAAERNEEVSGIASAFACRANKRNSLVSTAKDRNDNMRAQDVQGEWICLVLKGNDVARGMGITQELHHKNFKIESLHLHSGLHQNFTVQNLHTQNQ